jgi:subtilase family serine protease
MRDERLKILSVIFAGLILTVVLSGCIFQPLNAIFDYLRGVFQGQTAQKAAMETTAAQPALQPAAQPTEAEEPVIATQESTAAEGKADIVGSILYFTPEGTQGPCVQTGVGQRGTISAAVFNAGSADASNVSGHIEVDDVNVGELNFPAVAAGRESDPSSVAYAFNMPGRRMMRLCINPSLSESNTDNNSDLTSSVTVSDVQVQPVSQPSQLPPQAQVQTSSAIDLTGSRLYFMPDNSAQPALQTTVGQPGAINAAVYNYGSSTAFDVPVRVTDNGVFAGESTVLSVPPGQESQAYPIPYSFNSAGMHTLRLIVNPLNNPAETYLCNNSNLSINIDVLQGQQPPTTLSPAPDIDCTNLHFIDLQTGRSVTDAVVGQRGFVFVSLFNDSDSAASDVRYHISVDGNDYPAETVPNIAARSVYPKSYEPIAFDRPGVHSVGVFVDPVKDPATGNIVEQSIGNNSRVITINVSPQAPDEPAGEPADDRSAVSAVFVGFVPENNGHLDFVSSTEAGRLGYIVARVGNSAAHPLNNANFDVIVNGTRIGGGPASIGARTYIQPLYPHTFPSPGNYLIELKIPNATNPDNIATSTIEVVRSGMSMIRSELTYRPIQFIPNGSACPVTRTFVGRKGRIVAHVVNCSTSPASHIPVELKLDGRTIAAGTIDLRPMETKPFTVPDYCFDTAGSHVLSLSIDTPEHRRSERDPNNNETSTTIEVGTPHPIRDAACSSFVFIPAGSSAPRYETVIGREGRIEYRIENKTEHPMNNLRVVVRVDGSIKDDRRFDLAPRPSNAGNTVAGIRFDSQGLHTIRLEIDPDNEIPELDDRVNNVMMRSVDVKCARGPYNLTARSIAFIPEGSQQAVSATAAGRRGMLYGIIRSDEQLERIDNVEVEIKADNHVVGGRHNITIYPGRDNPYSVNNYAFNSAGRHVILLIVDPDMKISRRETFVDKNMEWQNVMVAASRLDLRGMVQYGPGDVQLGVAEATDGEQGNIYVAISNSGNAPAENVRYIVTDNGARTRPESEWTFPRIEPGAEQEHYFRGFSFHGVGDHTLKVTVDPDNRLGQKKEFTTRVYVRSSRPTPDLAWDTPIFFYNEDGRRVSQILVGDRVRLGSKIRNSGDGAAERVLSVLTIGGQEYQCSYSRIGPGETVDGPQDYFSFDRPGTYKATLVLDPDNTVRELHDNNNSPSYQPSIKVISTAEAGARLAGALLDARAVNIGFVPHGADSPVTEVYAGQTGSILAVMRNDQDALIPGLQGRIEVNGKVIKEFVRDLRPKMTMSHRVMSYKFDTPGTYKIRFIIDPERKVLDKKNIKGHEVRCTVHVRQKPKAKKPVVTKPVMNTTGLNNIIGTFKGSGGDSTYHPPAPVDSVPPPTTPKSPSKPPVFTVPTGVLDVGKTGGTSTKKVITPVIYKGIQR